MAVQSQEYKAVRAFLKTVGDIDFKPNLFALYLGMSSLTMQHRVIDLFMAFIDHLSRKIDEDLYSPEDYDICIRAKRIQEAMIPFR